MTGPGKSPAERLAIEFASTEADFDDAWSLLSVVEAAALAYDWVGFWARPEQVYEDAPEVASHGCLAGRGFGKTRTHVEMFRLLVEAGVIRRFGFCAQSEDETRKVLIDGESGFIKCSPPWNKCRFEGGLLRWDNGAVGVPFTPESPGKIRGDEFDGFYGTEIVVWAHVEETIKNIRYATRKGRALFVWDTTPKRKHSAVRMLLHRSQSDPRRHVIVYGSTDDNSANLSHTMLDQIVSDYGGSQAEREERFGEFIDDVDGALFKQAWIDEARRDLPSRLTRRVVAIDPAISMRKATDATGIVECGLGVDGQVFVLADWSGKHSVDEWAGLAVDRYMTGRCDCMVVERNRGGDLLVSLLRGAAQQRGLRLEVLPSTAQARHEPSTVYVREVIGRTGKDERASAIIPLYERGRVSHVRGADLAELEDVMTGWEPSDDSAASPNALDALVYAVLELAGLTHERVDRSQGMAAIPAVRAAAARVTAVHVPSMVRGAPRSGGRI